MTISEEELVALFSEENAKQVYVIQFIDGTKEELMDCHVLGDLEDRECFGTIVRTQSGSRYLPGQSISFSFDDVSDIEISEQGFDYYR